MGRGADTCSGVARPALISRRECAREALGQLVEGPVRELHMNPSRLRHSRRLGELLLRLYGNDPERAYREKVLPFVDAHRSELEAIYREHNILPIARCLDDYEGLMILQQLDEDPDRLRDRWPLDPEELTAVAAAAGVRVAAS